MNNFSIKTKDLNHRQRGTDPKWSGGWSDGVIDEASGVGVKRCGCGAMGGVIDGRRRDSGAAGWCDRWEEAR